QVVPPNNSTGKGFGVIVLNDAEDEFFFVAEFSGLSGNNTSGFIKPGERGQNSAAIISAVSFAGNTGTSNTSFQTSQKISPEEAQQLKNGLWYFIINSVNFHGGELRGKILL